VFTLKYGPHEGLSKYIDGLLKMETFPFRFRWRNAIPQLTRPLWVDVGGRGVPPRPLHHQFKSKYGHYFGPETYIFVTL